jgi:HAD superfamily hydrolase (TIGR01509 family)
MPLSAAIVILGVFASWGDVPNASAEASEGPVVIFDCNGVLVDGDRIASSVLADAFASIGLTGVTAEFVSRRFHGRRSTDVFEAVETATGRKLPPGFSATVANETLRRFRTELRPVPHAARALTWVRGPKAVASSSPFERIHAALEVTGLLNFFSQRLFSAGSVPRGKPAPDLFLHVASRLQVNPSDCIVVEDSAPGITAAAKAGMTPVGFVGGSDTAGRLARDLSVAGARAGIADMRALHGTIIDLRGW